ncbi:MAG: ester cyclase [Chloroflexi bacterium]|nr:ester cyclase [Chloroflexota bacterium]
MQDIIRLQRATVDEHIRTENTKDWEGVYNTFIQSDETFFDVGPMATRFKGIEGVKGIYQAINASFPDFQIIVTGEYDMPGCSIREVTIHGTHLGEYGGVPASGNPVRFELAAFFLFGSGENAGKLVCERVYWDNEILMRQIRGEVDAPTGIGLARLS